jgi:3-oxoacyl-[acyl-carrier-protein] synthase III
MSDAIYLSAPHYRHGALRDIEQIDALRNAPDLLETLHALGLATYSACSREQLYELAELAVGDVLRASGLAADQIDAIVYPSTCYFTGDASNDPNGAGSLLGHVVAAHGLQAAMPYGVSFSRCVNTVHAVELSRGLIADGRHRNILILAADSMQGEFARIVDPGISVVSDVASCMLASGRPCSEVAYRVTASAGHVDWTLAKLSAQTDFPDFLKRTVGGMAAVTRQLLQAERAQVGDYAQLITNTVNRSVLRIFSQATGFQAGDIFSANIGTLGHCDGSDLLINLKDYSASRNGAEHVLAIANGPYMWGGLALTRIC